MSHPMKNKIIELLEPSKDKKQLAHEIKLPVPPHMQMLYQPIPSKANLPYSVDLAKKYFSPAKLAVLLDVVSHADVDPQEVLKGTYLDQNDISNPFTITSSLQFLIAARNATKIYPYSNLGLKVGSQLHITNYGMYGYALLCSESLAQLFDYGTKFHRLANGMLDIYWFEHNDMATWIFPSFDEVQLPDIDERLYFFLIELQFAVTTTIIKDAMGPWCMPTHATFTYGEPAHMRELSKFLGCPLSFKESMNTLSYPSKWLSLKPQFSSPITAAQMSMQCARLLEDFHRKAGITRQVYQELTRFPGYFPDIEEIANNLCMTSRSLHRKLKTEGTSYSQQLTNIRKALAIDYLRTTELSISEIAQMLGFSDVVGFRHAFKRWTGKSPNQFKHSRFTQ
ncbi:AraC family transcriptional regulator [Acinetobacter seifertii]|uniref:AraC family transcriptional regulator n=1 Tax=Acinetobacter seifertii TaxID=1530123 RepID=UPI00280F5CEE|nr:AraC family transcriptional regulator [Acinetobacter seifertii]MDQ9037266.1 AraC family transcriptional regulator [Acinetobacter seifertii]